MTRKTWVRRNYGLWIIDFYLCSTVSSLVVWTNEFLTNDTFHSSTHQLRIHVVCWIGANKSIFNWLKKHWTRARAISLPLYHLPASLSILTLYSQSFPIPPSSKLPHTHRRSLTRRWIVSCFLFMKYEYIINTDIIQCLAGCLPTHIPFICL